MKKYKAIWKLEPTFELNLDEDLEEKEHDCLMDITMNPHDYIQFEEVEEKVKCPDCKSEDTYLTDLHKGKGISYRCNNCGIYF
uniref:Uncharacterized protein n=1 Tax=viral metagenome TaxID=1070528 RepID=A0A6M3LNW8_9ZZZZ